jgi:hypothetical protein
VDRFWRWRLSQWVSRVVLKRLLVYSIPGLEVPPWMLLILTAPLVLELVTIVTIVTLGPLTRRVLLRSSRSCGICVAALMMWLIGAWR